MPNNATITKQFIRPSDFQSIYGISRGTVFNWMKEGKLPAPKKLSARVIGWDRETLDSIFSAQ
jgi:predicted DNA-binding transcriptional regulator AlpA